jgi:hypothetical protein
VKRGAVIGIVVGGVVVVAAGGVAAWTLTRSPSASDVALSYLTALERGDAAAALAVTDASGEQRSQAESAYADATVRLADPRIADTTEDGGTATVKATYTLDAQEVEATLTLRDDGGWSVADGLGTVQATTTLGAAVAIGDVTLPAGGDPILLLPGRYEISAAPADILTGSTTVDVAPDAESTAAVEASLSPDATAVVQAQIDAYAQDCAKPATSVPAHCGLKVPWGADLSALKSLDFRIEKAPQVELGADATSFDATGGVILATARGASRGGGEGAFTYRADDWSLRGSMSFDGPELVLAVR